MLQLPCFIELHEGLLVDVHFSDCKQLSLQLYVQLSSF